MERSSAFRVIEELSTKWKLEYSSRYLQFFPAPPSKREEQASLPGLKTS